MFLIKHKLRVVFFDELTGFETKKCEYFQGLSVELSEPILVVRQLQDSSLSRVISKSSMDLMKMLLFVPFFSTVGEKPHLKNLKPSGFPYERMNQTIRYCFETIA